MKLSRRQVLLGLGATIGSVALSATSVLPALAKTRKLFNGTDLSWLPAIEKAGGRFYSSARKRTDAVALMHRAGLGVGRVRLWVNPTDTSANLNNAIALARRLKKNGMQFCLDFHFSDTWADPGQQTTPQGWSTTDSTLLENQLSDYVSTTLTTFKRLGLAPQWVQLGNEIANGFLWPLGKIDSADADQWQRFAQLQMTAATAMRRVLPKAKWVMHLDCGGDAGRVRWWLEQAANHGLRGFDVVGLSYYSQWQGSLENLRATLDVVARDFELPVLIAETAYPYTTERFGNDVIDVGRSALPGLPFTRSGQRAFVNQLRKMLLALPNHRGVGIWWWEGLSRPVITASGLIKWNGGMANASLVSDHGIELPALKALAC